MLRICCLVYTHLVQRLNSIVFTVTGAVVAVASDDTSVKLYNVANGQVKNPFYAINYKSRRAVLSRLYVRLRHCFQQGSKKFLFNHTG